jgi:branched-chain amino acid transport system permease protein
MINNWKGFTAAAIIVVILAVVPLFIEIRPDTMSLLIMLWIYIILSQSWNLMGGYTGQMNLGLAAFFGCGALITRFICVAGFPFALAILGGSIAAAILSVIIGIPSLRLKGIYFAIGTLALAEALRIVISNVFPITIYATPAYIAEYNVLFRYYVGLGLAAATTIAVYIIANSRLGLALLAVRDDEVAAKVTGVNTFKYKVIVFIISSFLAGMAGGVLSFYELSLSPVGQFTPLWTFGPLMAAAIGGIGTITGPIIGCVFLVIIEDWFNLALGEAHYIVFGILFILVILFLPGGIIEAVDRIRRLFTRLTARKANL